MPLLWILLLALCHVGTHAQVLLNYTEVQKLGNSCPQLDSCGHQRSTGTRELFSIKERNCACDYLCMNYGDCCIDAPGVVPKNTLPEYSCLELRQFGGVYIKDSCPPSYNGPNEVKYLCEDTSMDDQSDPLGSLPVTDSVTGNTYKNYYCSICNNNTENAVLWTPRLECPTITLLEKDITHDYIFQNLAINPNGNSWGLYLAGDNGSMFFNDCQVDPVMPALLESKIRLCKPDLVSSCAPDWKDQDVSTMCRSYMGTKFIHGGDRFRNVHCALCNHVNVTHLSCRSAESREIIFRQFESHAFSLLLDVNEGRGEEVGFVQKCANGEVFDPFFKKCRSLSCLPGYVRQGNGCVQNLEDTGNSSGEGPVISPELVEIEREENAYDTFAPYDPLAEISEKNSSKLKGLTGTSYNSSTINTTGPETELRKLQNCLLISLTDEDYLLLKNNSIYVPKYDKVYEPTSYHTADGSILVCSHLKSDKDVKFMPSMGYLTVSGLIISMFCLFMHFVAFWIVPDLQNLSGKSLVSQCVSLFFAYLCFIIGLSDNLGYTGCSIIAFLTFYFFQVSFFWMATMAYDVWRTLRMATTELRVSNGKQLRRFISYSFFTWTTPLFILITIAMAEFTDLFPRMYKPDFASPRCWFKRRRSLLVFFVVPLIVIMVGNIVLFVSSSRMILMTTQTSVKQHNQSNRRNFKLYLRLALLMGLTWIIGIVAGYADIDGLWYFFVALNTLQGLFIFVSFTCSTKVWNFMKEKLRKKSSEFKSTTHTASTGSARTNSTNLHTSLAKKFSSKLLVRKTDSGCTASTGSRCTNSPI
ncbi:hypothetical protein JTE90_023335 [Oedothorax gibbosus]|uniref:G-protein coupled receptor Mth2 n=1 Tax=Oedothorax gibbosus TaxID=931172 RepID=A0AAV6VGF6_9ARAC|nr:hypothetical protein JTE90_023335 [Oedothorax gibbosus]